MNTYLFKLIDSLQQLVTFDISFITSHHNFIGKNETYVSISEFPPEKSGGGGRETVFLPFIVDDVFSGCFVVDSDKLFSKEQINLVRTILASSCNNFFKAGNHKTNILYPLNDEETKDYLNSLQNYSNFTDFNRNHSFAQIKSITNIEKALSYINSNIAKPLNLEIVSKAIYISPTYLSRLFKSDLNINFIDYINISKMNLAQEKLILTKVPIIDLANDLGFAQASYFTKLFKRWTGLTPSEYRQKNKNVQQVYTIFRTPNWTDTMNVFEATKQYLEGCNIPLKTKKIDSSEYIYSIDNMVGKANHNNGWIYTVDCTQPANLSNEVSVRKQTKLSSENSD